MAVAKSKTRSKKAAPEVLISRNPQTGEQLGEIRANSPGEIADIVAQARKVAPEWGAIAPEGRARFLRQVRYRIYERMDDLVDTISAECGKPKSEALALDVFGSLMLLSYLERIVDKTLKPQRVGRLIGPLLTGTSSRIEWRPFGVVGCITPWNYPLTNCFLAVAPPLFAGNAVVIKPSEATPACGELIRDVLDPLPAGVATVVQGGGEVGAALVDAPCDKISFIGSPATGRKICEVAAKHLTPVVMELGGKDAAIVAADADIDVASSGILWGSFFNAGQTCCSVERAFVVDSVADEFRDKLVSKLSTLRQGPGESDVGSITFPPQLEIVKRHVDDAVAKGAEVVAGGSDAGIQNKDGSLWFAPTIISNVKEDMDLVKEETFGPVLQIVRVHDEEEAVRRANEDGVNLTASVWTSNRKRADDLASKLRAGAVSSNDHGVLPGAVWAPWGGVGESGYGRLNGYLGIREFTVPTHVAHNLMPKRKKPYWYPYNSDSTATFRALATVIGSPEVKEKVKAAGTALKHLGRTIKSRL